MHMHLSRCTCHIHMHHCTCTCTCTCTCHIHMHIAHALVARICTHARCTHLCAHAHCTMPGSCGVLSLLELAVMWGPLVAGAGSPCVARGRRPVRSWAIRRPDMGAVCGRAAGCKPACPDQAAAPACPASTSRTRRGRARCPAGAVRTAHTSVSRLGFPPTPRAVGPALMDVERHGAGRARQRPVSYTHLTLPTK